MIFIILIISFILELLFTNIIPLNSILIPMFTLVSLVLLYPLFKNKNNYLITCLIVGLLYDIYCSSLFINTLTFSLCGYLISIIFHFITDNIQSNILISIILIILFRTISYTLLIINDYTMFNINILLKGIYSSLIINLIYAFILNIIIKIKE